MKHAKRSGWRPFWAALCAALLVLLPLVGGTVLLSRAQLRSSLRQAAKSQSGVPIRLPKATDRCTVLLCVADETPGFVLAYLNAGQNCIHLLAVLFAAFCALASFGIGNLSQLNSIAGNLQAAFGVPEAVTGAVLAAVSAVILLGGLKRVAAVAERLVPAMALLYIVGALTVVGVHITAVPAALATIVKGAFGLRAAGGGIVGYGLSRAVTWGFKRGAFSNEAGLGSSVMVHAASNVKEPVQQGMWGIFEVFADTMVVCTLTALVVLTSGFVDLDTGRIAAGAAGSALVGQAFDAVFGTLGSKLIAVCILLFAYSTALGWSCYGCKAVEYLFGAGAGTFYRVLFVALMPLGAVMRLDLAWTLSDTFNGLMMLPNLIGVVALSGTVVKITQNHLARKLHGSAAPPLLSAGETI